MPSTVNLPFIVEVDQIDQQLFALTAHEALGMPMLVVTGPVRPHNRVTDFQLFVTLHARLKQQ